MMHPIFGIMITADENLHRNKFERHHHIRQQVHHMIVTVNAMIGNAIFLNIKRNV